MDALGQFGEQLEKLELVSAAPQATLNSLRFFSVLLASYFLHPKLDIRSLSMGILFNSFLNVV